MFSPRMTLLALLAFTPPALAATALIPLQHRSADELLPVVQALLNDGETLVAHEQQLLVRASLERIDELRGVLTQLDVPVRQLLISLENRAAQSLPAYRASGPAPATRQMPRVVTAGGFEPLRIRASEGRPAFIDVTRSEPRLGFNVDLNSNPYLQSEEMHSGAGLHVVARLMGNTHVQLDLNMVSSAADLGTYGALERLQSETRIVGRLGEWIEVTGDQRIPARDRTISPPESAPWRIRVEILE